MGRFVFKALTGPVKGQVFPVKHGLRIGRSLGDIVLKDPLVSDLHAEIQIYSNGKIMIVDKDSKNKIFMNDKRTVKSILENGSRFKIGQTEFVMDFIQTPEEIVIAFIKKNTKDIQDQPLSLQPFFQAIEIIFLSGIQKGEKHYLTYGPRFFGCNSVDFPIFEKKAPKKAFALVPDKSDTFFVTSEPLLVQFNEQKTKRVRIQSGDKISIGNTILKINLK